MILFLLAFFTVGHANVSPTTVLSLEEQARIKQIFYDAAPFTDLATAHHATAGLKTLKAEIPPTQVNIANIYSDTSITFCIWRKRTH